jgi:hypothetical protein
MPAAAHVAPLFALFAWIPIGLFLFYRYPVRIAILLTFIAGWAILPTANFVPTDAAFPYWIMSVSLPTGYFVTKATITAVTALTGVILFDARGLWRFRMSVWDFPMILWCAVPLLSGIANHGPYDGALRYGLRGALYQCLAWGVPYLLGRVYFADDVSLKLAAKAFVIAGLCYVPICILEIIAGPQLYAHVYGYQPFRWLGAERYVGFRPIGFLEDGNQLGIWMAAATLLAAGLWKHSQVRRVLGLPIGWAAVILFVATVLCQSGGSIVLLLCLLPFVLLSGVAFRRRFVVALAFIVLCFAGLRLTNVVSLRWMVDHVKPARAVATFFAEIGRGSFGWRLEQDERHVKTALATPFLGSGRWDWWRNGENRPWGLWLLAYGMYGGVGLLALEGMQFLPVARAAWLPTRHDRFTYQDSTGDGDVADPDLRLALGAVLLLAAIDNLLNSGMILPLALVIGGMSVGGEKAGRLAS